MTDKLVKEKLDRFGLDGCTNLYEVSCRKYINNISKDEVHKELIKILTKKL